MGYEKPSQKLTFYKAFFSHRWKFLIHTILQCLSAKTTIWNEFNSTMASAIIYLANNHKFNFSKYILDNMVKNLEARVKFYMFPRFVQVFVNHQLGDMSHHNGIFVNPSLTKKVFANMKRLGTSFFGVITPLFKTMMVQAPKEVDEIPTDTQDTPILTQPSSSQPQRKHKPIKNQRKETETNQAAKIKKLKKRVKKLKGKKKKRTHGLKWLYKVGLTVRIESFKEEKGRMNNEDLFEVNDLDGDVVIVDVTAGENVEQDATVAKKEVSAATNEVFTTAESVKEPSKFRTTSSSQPSQLPHAKDKGKGIIVEPEKPLKKKDQITFDEVVARKLDAQMKAKIEEEDRVTKEKDKANRAVIKEWDDVQATIDADRQLAEQLQAQEKEQLSIEEKSKLLAKFIESRRVF
nr:hypothetical protein [Tanacetum cinerariifolium]